MNGADCPACDGSWPAGAQRIADLGATVAYLHEDQAFPGWSVLVLKRHATELYELTSAERGEVIENVSRMARVLATTFRAVKVNYALLGNVLPHIHWQVMPRAAADPAPKEPVWAIPHDVVRLSPAALSERISRIRSHLG